MTKKRLSGALNYALKTQTITHHDKRTDLVEFKILQSAVHFVASKKNHFECFSTRTNTSYL